MELKLTFDKHIDSFFFGNVVVKPIKDLVWVNGLIDLLHQVLEDQALFTCSVGSDPQPAIPHVVVHEEDVALLEPVKESSEDYIESKGFFMKYLREFISVGHFGVGQDGYHTLFVINRFRWGNWVD